MINWSLLSFALYWGVYCDNRWLFVFVVMKKSSRCNHPQRWWRYLCHLLRWWRYLHHLPGRGLRISRADDTWTESKYLCVWRKKVIVWLWCKSWKLCVVYAFLLSAFEKKWAKKQSEWVSLPCLLLILHLNVMFRFWCFKFSRQLVRLNSALQVAGSLMQMLLLQFLNFKQY